MSVEVSQIYDCDTLSSKMIKNIRWYYRLVKGDNGRSLMDRYDISSLIKGLVICYAPKKSDEKSYHLYARFDMYMDFYKYMLTFPKNERHFYEVIMGEGAQKPHFDIDISDCDDFEIVANDTKDHLIRSIIEVFESKKLKIDIQKDILIYSSHGEKKRSFHLVVNNKCHQNNREAKIFYEKVIQRIPEFYKKFIDRAVYSPRQQFRILGSQKVGSDRPKMFSEIFTFKNVKYYHEYTEEINNPFLKGAMLLYESLVSFTATCNYLPTFLNEDELNSYSDIVYQEISEQQVEDALNLLDDDSSVLSNVIDGIILLKRIRASRCPSCSSSFENKIHEHENPFMFIVDDKVYWNCRRTKKNLYLGLIKNVEEKKFEDFSLKEDEQPSEIKLTPLQLLMNLDKKRPILSSWNPDVDC